MTERIRILSEEGIRSFKKFLEDLFLSDETVKNYYYICRRIFRGKEDISFSDIMEVLKKDKRSRTLSAIKYMLTWLGREELIKKIPKFKPLPAKPRKIPTYNDFMNVIDRLDDEERFISLFLLNTGARCGEIFKVKLRDINNKEGDLILETSKKGKYREIKIPRYFHSEILSYIKIKKGLLSGEYIFYTDNKPNPLSKLKKFHAKLNKVSMKTIGKNIGTHDFRRHYGTFLYSKTKDILLVQRLMGHSDIKTTSIYAKYATKKEDMEIAVQLLDDLQRSRQKLEIKEE